MLLSAQELRQRCDCGALSDEAIEVKLSAIEAVIRAYTNNTFQNRAVRFEASASGCEVFGASPFLRVGDTVQISASGVNNGVYTVISVAAGRLVLDRELFEAGYNLVTKVEYPADVVSCAVELFRWGLAYGGKIGVKSETLSRHSVSYEDSAGLYAGYPVGILSGLKLYRRART